MKQGIHPDYKPATIVCACGNRVETMSTEEEIHVEICSVCHPFYTGKQRLVDTAGRVERFKRKYGDQSSAARAEAEAEASGEAEKAGAEKDAETEGEAGEKAGAPRSLGAATE